MNNKIKEKSFEELVEERAVITETSIDCLYEYDYNGNLIHYKDSNGCEYDKNNNCIRCKNSKGFEYWKEYDENNNMIHYKDSNGYELWREYDKNNNMIHDKDYNGYEYWKEYDENNNLIHYKDSNGHEYYYDSNGDFITKEEYDKIKKSPDIINFHYDEPLGFRSEKKEYTDEKVSLFTRIKNIFSRT